MTRETRRMRTAEMPTLIGIAGGTGAGKRTLVGLLCRRLTEVCVVDRDADDVDRHRTGPQCRRVLEQYVRTVRPMHERQVEPASRHADVVVLSTGPMDACLDRARHRACAAGEQHGPAPRARGGRSTGLTAMR